MAEKPPEKAHMLLSMVALDTPSLPRQPEMLEMWDGTMTVLRLDF